MFQYNSTAISLTSGTGRVSNSTITDNLNGLVVTPGALNTLTSFGNNRLFGNSSNGTNNTNGLFTGTIALK
jgi:hypothetical protein